MARRRTLYEPRSDWRGGLNTIASPDSLNRDELVQATNVQLYTQQGAIAKRAGSRRLHTTAIGSGNPVTGVFQWTQDDGTRELIAICGGNFYNKTTDFGEFAETVENFAVTLRQSFAVARASSASAALRVYIADGNVHRWTGSAITQVSGTNSVPPANIIRSYHTRLIGRHVSFLKSLFWSVVGDPEDFTDDGTPLNGGSALVNTVGGENIQAMEVLGNSLLVAFEDSISRFSGYSSQDFQLAQDTEGVSSVVGTYNKNTFKRIEEFAMTLADRGPYLVLESGVTHIGQKVEPSFSALDRANMSTAVVGYHKGRKQAWFAVPGADDSGENRTVYVWDVRLQAWMGPFTYPFGITCLTNYEDSNGDEAIIAGCEDGFVRHLDTGALDDVLADGTGGSTYTMTAELAPILTAVGPGYTKALRDVDVQADVSAGASLQIGVAFDQNDFTYAEITGAGEGTTLNYPVPLSGRGKRLRIRITDSSPTIPIVNGIIAKLIDYRRPG